MKKPLLMDLEDNVTLEGDVLVIIDRRRLPREIVRLSCPDHEAVARAIEEMAVQGAGDIAITAGFGLYLAARALERSGTARKTATLREAANRLIATRPTGFHLAALVNKLMGRIEEAGRCKARLRGHPGIPAKGPGEPAPDLRGHGASRRDASFLRRPDSHPLFRRAGPSVHAAHGPRKRQGRAGDLHGDAALPAGGSAHGLVGERAGHRHDAHHRQHGRPLHVEGDGQQGLRGGRPGGHGRGGGQQGGDAPACHLRPLLQNPLLHSRLRRAGQTDALRRRHPDRGAGPEGGSRVPGHTHQRPRREGLLPGLRPHAGGAGDGDRDGKRSGAEEESKKGGRFRESSPLLSRPGFRAILSMFNH